MKNKRTLAERTKLISGKILESLELIEVLYDLSDGDSRIVPIITIVERNLKSAFRNIETSRDMISVPD